VGRGKVGRGKVVRGKVGREKVGGKRTGFLSSLVVIFNREIAAPEEVMSGGCRAVIWAATFVQTKGLSFGCSSHRTTADRCN